MIEMIDQVALSDRPLAEQLRIIRGNYCAGSGEFDALDEAADVVECNQREIAGLKGERKGILKANESLAADNTRLRDELAAKDTEIARLRALVKEMLSHIEELYQCKSPCDSRCLHKKESCEFRVRRELIAKAREVVE